jgi:hypothetical protein
MSWDPRDFGQKSTRAVPNGLAMSHRAGRALPPPPVPVIDQPVKVAPDATTVTAQVMSAQNNYYQFARDHFASRNPADEIEMKLDNAAVANTELACAATQLGPAAIKAQVVDPTQQALDEAIASKRILGDPAEETRMSRFWSGFQGELDSKTKGAEVVTTAQKRLESADGTELSVLYEQLPGYLRAKGIDDSFILPTLARRPEMKPYADNVIAANKALHVAQCNATMLERAVKDGRVPQALISTIPFAQQ